MDGLNPLPVDIIMFDLDGTLIDSLADIVASVNHVMRHFDRPELAPTDVRGYVGDGVRRLLQRCLEKQETDEGLDAAIHLYRLHHLDQCTATVRPYPGVDNVLSHFKRQRKAVISNKPFEFTEKILRHLNLDRHFDIILGGDSLPQKKPDPLPLRHVVATLAGNPARSVMVGDGRQDIQAGIAAGVLTIGLRGGFGRAQELIGADRMIDTLSELKDFLI